LVTMVTLSSIAAWHFSSAVLTINTIEQRVTKVTRLKCGNPTGQGSSGSTGLSVAGEEPRISAGHKDALVGGHTALLRAQVEHRKREALRERADLAALLPLSERERLAIGDAAG